MRHSGKPGNAAQQVRITLAFTRSDDPQLFDALIALPKGRRRVTRLRTLAHDGLLAQTGMSSPPPPANLGHAHGAQTDVAEPMENAVLATVPPDVTAAVFDAPLEA